MSQLRIVETIAEVRDWRTSPALVGKAVGFVPTMGGLHAGHESLIRQSADQTDFTAVSIFVNPLQFGVGEDFERYPRTIESDLAICRSAGADLVLIGNKSDLYPPGFETHIEPGPLADVLCGASRPGHFRGVLTVVAKLFGIFQPTNAYFGRKDFQQCVLVQRMIEDLNLPTQLVVCETIREPDGLAMSTRNRYLSPADRKRALCLWRAIQAARQLFAGGELGIGALQAVAAAQIASETSAEIDYLELVDAKTLRPPAQATPETVIALAVRIGGARLIDNASIG